MFDVKWIRDNGQALDAGLAKRGLAPAASPILDLDARHRAVQTALQESQARRNELAKRIGTLKSKGEDAGAAIAEVSALKTQVQQGEEEERKLSRELGELLSGLPNVVADEVPVTFRSTHEV